MGRYHGDVYYSGGAEGREVIRAAGVVDITVVAPHGRPRACGPLFVDGVLSGEQLLEPLQGGLHARIAR